jgi:hypothetical protein
MLRTASSLKNTASPHRTAGLPPLAFFNIPVGGIGTAAGQHILQRYHGDGSAFPMGMLHIDTDPATYLDADDHVLVQLTAADVRAMRANPSRFGEVAAAIIRELGRLLRDGDILNGSRTTRALTQLALIRHIDRLCSALRRAFHRLRERFKVSYVMPVIISSSGGGTGSAFQVLLMQKLQDPGFRHRLLGGIPSDLLLAPLSVVVEPHAYANATSLLQSRKIMANGLAFRLESEVMLQRGAASYVCHLGYANAGGTVLADPELMAKVLGYGVYEIERNWAVLKGRWVDGPDDVAFLSKYAGEDSPHFEPADGHTFHVRRKPS